MVSSSTYVPEHFSLEQLRALRVPTRMLDGGPRQRIMVELLHSRRREESERLVRLQASATPFGKLCSEAGGKSGKAAQRREQRKNKSAGSRKAQPAGGAGASVRRLLKSMPLASYPHHRNLRFDTLDGRPKPVRCAIHVAAGSAPADAVRALIEGGADVDSKDESGCTALHWAAVRPDCGDDVSAGHTTGAKRDGMDSDGCSVIALLLEHGADADARNEMGKTPEEWAFRCGNKAAVAVFRAHAHTSGFNA